jgi:MFS superfamily sulfate permease-like transporter
MGHATTPRKETPKSSKELNVVGPGVWAVLGVVVAIAGIVLFSVLVIAVGIGICIASLMVSRMNKTQQRLRSDIRNESKQGK